MDFQKARVRMVEMQVEGRGIRDLSVLKALDQVPRHQFVPEELRVRSYDDCPLPIGEGQTISQPYIVGLMSELLALKKDDVVYEVGTGSGYQAAILSRLARVIFTVERIQGLAFKASGVLKQLRCDNVHCVVGDGLAVLHDEGEYFDSIILTAAAPQLPIDLCRHLKAGGRLIAPIGHRGQQTLTLFIKSEAGIISRPVCQCSFVPLLSPKAFKE